MGARKEKDMFDLISRWENSDEDRTTFCNAHGVTLFTFSYWRTKYLKSQGTPTASGFFELKPAIPKCLEIVYPNGVVVRLPHTSSLSELKALIQLG